MALDAQIDKGAGMTDNAWFFTIAISFLTAILSYLFMRRLTHRSLVGRARALLAEFDDSRNAKGKPAESFSIATASSVISSHRYGKWLRNEANQAGIWRDLDFQRIINRKILLSISVFLICALITPFTSLPLSFLIGTTIFAFFIPDLMIVRKRQRRLQEITRAIPETIDLISMCVTAGIGFHAGMQRVAEKNTDPLSEEFNRVLSEMQLGVGRSQALLAMSQRLGIDELKGFVNSVLQVDRLGIPMAKVLEEQSIRMRTIKRERAREQAQKLPVKILAPIMLFMLPALLIIVLGPAVVTIMRTFS
jgi:tight adherence protein C